MVTNVGMTEQEFVLECLFSLNRGGQEPALSRVKIAFAMLNQLKEGGVVFSVRG